MYRVLRRLVRRIDTNCDCYGAGCDWCVTGSDWGL